MITKKFAVVWEADSTKMVRYDSQEEAFDVANKYRDYGDRVYVVEILWIEKDQ